LLPELAERLSEFLRRVGRFETEFGSYSEDDHKVDESRWLAADELSSGREG
jgi:hypothetical protein